MKSLRNTLFSLFKEVLEAYGWILLIRMVTILWEHFLYEISPSYSDHTLQDMTRIYWNYEAKYYVESIGPIVIVVAYLCRTISLAHRRVFCGSLILLSVAAILFSITYTKYTISPSLCLYSILENKPFPEIAVHVDPKIRLEFFVYPGTEEDCWLREEFIPKIRNLYGEQLHIIISDRTHPDIQNRLFLWTFRENYFDDDPIYVCISDATFFFSRMIATRSAIQKKCETYILGCIETRRTQEITYAKE